MSGRGAYARATVNKQADKKSQKSSEYVASELHSYTFSSGPVSVSRPPLSTSQTYGSQPPAEYYASPVRGHPHRRSVSSAGSYGVPQPRKPRPIVVASAIEKSDFRTHLDGMSNNLRGKLGKLFGSSDSDSTSTLRRPNTTTNTTTSSGSDSPDATFTPPPDNAGRSLSPVTSPSEINSAYPGFGDSTSKSRTSHDRHATLSEPSVKSKQRGDSVLHQIRRFEGGGKLPQLGWKSMATNPELWDENGDTFVYVYIRGSRTKPPPSFRLKSRVMEASGSKQLLDRLYNTREPEGWPKFSPYSQPHPGQLARSASLENTIGSDTYNSSYRGTESDDSDVIRPLGVRKKETSKAPSGIEHEIYFEWPGSETGVHSTIWHVTTRNFFAIMYDASSLVGTTLYDCLKMLLERLLMYSDYLDRSISHVGWITDYLVRHKFDDVRNNPSYAASLLAFSELPQVRWSEGYIEAFVHCAGMLRMGLETVTEWRHVSPVTKMYLTNANLELEERIHRAQVWLHDFDFSEMWPASSAPPSSARGCCDRFRKWLCKYYENAFLHWPPSNEETWMSRDVVLRLRTDFHGLYDYIVDRDVAFDGSDCRPGQRWNIVSNSNRHFHADSVDLPMTDMLLAFDARNNFPHIPHPYPKVPPSLPTALPKATGKSAGFHIKKIHGGIDNPAEARRKALSYAEASNVYLLRDQYVHTDLVANFIRFEQSDMVDQSDPYEARRGRWILIYGILQVLATVSVDHPNLRYNDGAQYHLSPQMKGVLPWSPANAPPEEEADHTHSHCWVAPLTWREQANSAVQKQQQQHSVRAVPHGQGSTQHRPIIWGQYGDGRVRGDYNNNEHVTSPSSERGRTRDTPETSPANARTHHKLKASRSTSAMNTMSNTNRNNERGDSRKRMEEWVANTKGGVGPARASSATGESSAAATTQHGAPSSSASDAGNNGGAKFGTFTTVESLRPPSRNGISSAVAANTSSHNNSYYPPRSGSRLGANRRQQVSQSGSSEGWSVADTVTGDVSVTREVNTAHAANAMSNVVAVGNTQGERRGGKSQRPGMGDRSGTGYQPPADW